MLEHLSLNIHVDKLKKKMKYYPFGRSQTMIRMCRKCELCKYERVLKIAMKWEGMEDEKIYRYHGLIYLVLIYDICLDCENVCELYCDMSGA